MKNTKFIVKIDRLNSHTPQYVQRINLIPIQTTSDIKLALAMGKFTAEDAAKSVKTSRCTPELVSVRVTS
jgi:hypothetical protein